MSGAWDAMLRWEDEHAGIVTSVPGIEPSPIGAGPDREISSQAGLSALRYRRGGPAPSAEG